MTMKQFTTAAKTQEGPTAAPVPIVLDGKTLTFKGPNDKTMLMLMSIYAELDSGDQLRALGSQINLVFNLLEGDDRHYIRRRMFDPEDDFGGEELVAILRHLVEEWTGRPTEPPSDSASPPPPTGDAWMATPPPAGSIPPTFGQTGS